MQSVATATNHDTPRRILILYANTGGGHISAARAIQAAIAQRHPGQYTVDILNISVASGSKRIGMLYDTYNLMLKADPRYTKYGLRLLNSLNAEKVVIPWMPRAYHNVRRALLRAKPDLIVSVHAIINYSAIRALRESGRLGRLPYVIVCTDLTNNFLKGWANPDVTQTIAFTDTARQQLITFGVPPERITVLPGFPINPAFFEDHATKAECREQLGLDPTAFTVLIAMGGMAVPHHTICAVRALQRSNLPLQLVVICGANRSLQRKMERMARTARLPMRVTGFTDRLPQFMTAADVMVAKPGPATIMEAIAKELPLLLDGSREPMPQEKGNLDYAMRKGVALKITSYRLLPEMVHTLMTDKVAYHNMQACMRAVSHPGAIFDIADTLLTFMPEHTPTRR